ncbi:MAG: hypothetical protein ACP5GZ_11365 [Vulcanisaeta sp.]|uniref:hypothetical protein n=1 Tax=Vulcanisaeta sp. TaxID=2020871 RepID=UPI003D147240
MTYIGVRIVEFADKLLSKMGITSFGKALVYITALLTIVFIVLAIIAILSLRRGAVAMNGGLMRISKYNKLLGLLILAISTIIPISAAVPIDSIYRFFGYFILATIDTILMALYIMSNGQRKSYLLYGATVILLTAVVSVFVKNHFFGSTFPYNFKDEPLYTQGNLTEYQITAIKGGFYYFIPTDAINLVTIGLYTNLVDPLAVLYDSLFAVVTVLSLIAFFERFRLRGAVLSTFLIFVPPLSFLIARVGSLPYTASALMSLAIMLTGGSIMGAGVLYALFALDAIFAHPVGPVAMTALLLIAYLIIPMIKIPRDEKARIRSIIGKALAILTIMEFAYWVGVDIAMFLIIVKVNRTINALQLFTNTIVGGNTTALYNISPTVAPGYSSPEVRVFSYIWAFPIALSLVLIALIIIYGINRMNKLNTMNWLGLVIGFSSSLSSILSTAFGYADYTAGLTTGQYLLPVAYLLALIGATTMISIFLRSKSRIIAVVFTLLFAIFVFLGVYSPDWAPIENSSIFHVMAMVHPYYVPLESKQLSPIIPKSTPFYAQDGLPFGSQGKIPSAYILQDFSACNFNTLLGVYINQVPSCVLNDGDLSLMTTQGYAVLTPINR